MRIPLFQVDAFTRELFRGNPAAVCPLESWLSESVMQAIAAENNVSDTAFFVGRGNHYEIRWFTPRLEIDLCGHATLAAAFVLFNALGVKDEELVFISRSGPLRVRREGERSVLDFPAWELGDYPVFQDLVRGLGSAPQAVWTSGAHHYLAVFERESQVRELQPDFELLKRLDRTGVVVTAPGESSDFVSRYFAPLHGVPEDPVTGSAHCGLTPYWARRLGKDALYARQISQRGGELWCTLAKDRVRIAGHAVKFSEGLIELPPLEARA
jgi:predicted PhzF superfamily epimerase YddE/YHI9